MRRLIISDDADADLEDIGNFIGQDSQAINYHGSLRKLVMALRAVTDTCCCSP